MYKRQPAEPPFKVTAKVPLLVIGEPETENAVGIVSATDDTVPVGVDQLPW